MTPYSMERDLRVGSGAGGEDFMIAFTGSVVEGGAGADYLFAISYDEDQVQGGGFEPSAVSEAHGGAGDDVLYARGNARVFGGEGRDVLFVQQRASASGGAGSDVLIGIADEWTGLANRLELRGDDGNDLLFAVELFRSHASVTRCRKVNTR